MDELVNPFRPTAGAEPPVLIGRAKVINDFRQGLREGVGAPARLMRITGPRGSGKTVLLTELGDMARERGWRVVDVTASEGLVDTIVHQLGDYPSRAEVELGASTGILKAKVKHDMPATDSTLRDVLTDVASVLTRQGAGLLVTVDEIQDAEEADVRALATSVQHLIRERMNIAFVFAGITTGVMDLLNGRALTFLRRAKAEELAPIPLDEVADALRASIEQSGLSISQAALDKAAEVTRGYAFLIQLVGYAVWNEAYAHASRSLEVEVADVHAGIDEAMKELNNALHETAVADLPLRAMKYLLAMTEDNSVSATRSIAERLGISASNLTSYRRMLVKRQVIEPTARGYVTFTIPYMKEFLVDHKDELLARYGIE